MVPRRMVLFVASVLTLVTPAAAFFEQIFEQMQAMGGGHHGPQWPQGVSDKIVKKYNFLKGTEWLWNGVVNVQFQADGKLKHSQSQACMQGFCLWSANRNRVWVLLPDQEGGLAELLLPDNRELPESVYDEQKFAGLRMAGKQAGGARPVLTFHRVFDTEAADLEKDLYGVLGLDVDASDAEVKKAYRKLSVKYHPDKTGDDAAAKKRFQEVRDAYEVLGNEEKKVLYDTGGLEAVKNAEKGRVQKGATMRLEFRVSLEQLYRGHEQRVGYNRRVVCRGCRQRPDSDKCRACQRCPNERRTVHQQVGNGMFIQREQEIPSQEKCRTEETKLDLIVERGMKDGEELTFPLKAEERPNVVPGDVVAQLRLDPNMPNSQTTTKFTRTHDDLHADVTISISEALLGFRKTIRHLDGHQVTVGSTDVTSAGSIFKVAGEGMPLRDDPQSFGNLYIRVNVAFPTSLTANQKTLLRQAFGGHGGSEEL